MSVGAGAVPPGLADGANAEPQQASQVAQGQVLCTELEQAEGGSAQNAKDLAPEGLFNGVPQAGRYAEVSKKSGLLAWSDPGNRAQAVPSFQTVYWHVKLVRKGHPDLFLSPGVKISLDADGEALYMAAVTSKGLSTQLLVCNEDKENVRLAPIVSCNGVVRPKGELEHTWVAEAVRAFGEMRQKEQEAGLSVARWSLWARTHRDIAEAVSETGVDSVHGAVTDGKVPEVARLSGGDDPVFAEAWAPKQERKARHNAVSVSPHSLALPRDEAAHRRRSRASGRKGKRPKAVVKQEEDDSINESPFRPNKKAAIETPEPAGDMDQVQAGVEEGVKRALTGLQGAHIGNIEINIHLHVDGKEKRK